MYDLTLVARKGRWVLVEEGAGEVGQFTSRADALDAAGAYERHPYHESRHVLIQEEFGEWDEALVEAPRLN